MLQSLLEPAPADHIITKFVLLAAVIHGAGFFAYVWLSGDGARVLPINAFLRPSIERSALIGAVITGAGLFFLGIRVLEINPLLLGTPLLLWLTTLAAVAYTGWFLLRLRAARVPRSNGSAAPANTPDTPLG